MDIEDSDITINTTAFTVAEADQFRMMPDSRSRLIIPTKKPKVGSWNVRSCTAESTQMLLVKEKKKYGLNICWFPETRLNDILVKSVDLDDSTQLNSTMTQLGNDCWEWSPRSWIPPGPSCCIICHLLAISVRKNLDPETDRPD